MKQAVKYDGKTFRYLEKILSEWAEVARVKTLDDVFAYQNWREQKCESNTIPFTEHPKKQKARMLLPILMDDFTGEGSGIVIEA